MLSLLARNYHAGQTTGLIKIVYKRNLLSQLSPALQLFTSYASTCGGKGKGAKSKHSITYKPYCPPQWKQHDIKNMDLNRPMSPHLTIYAPTLPAMTSIVQRITGVIVLAYALLLSFGTLFLPNGVESYVSMIQSLDLSRIVIFLIKIIIGAPFVYHYFNGIRYCAWNACKWLELKDVFDTAKKSFILTAVFTLLFAFL